jgi:hypothetical protein
LTYRLIFAAIEVINTILLFLTDERENLTTVVHNMRDGSEAER